MLKNIHYVYINTLVYNNINMTMPSVKATDSKYEY